MFVFGMTLEQYLTVKKLSDADFGREIGVSARAVGYYRASKRIPRPKVMDEIIKATGGKVAPSSFYS